MFRLPCRYAALWSLPLAAHAAEVPGPGIAQFGQTLLALCFVIALIVAAAFLMRRFSLLPMAAGSRLRVVSGVMVGAKERVVIVEVESTWLVVGVTSENVNLLHTLPRPADAPPAPQAAIPVFAEKLAALMKRNKPDA
ncbi:flagellar biosynthetic protein FliO [Chitinolyticbacter albus]|uniref:flagellar biosynthetic protein FliO n=1 Tax=Chitinolyticbacter albus TaxID=2961951 RepID=UPI00210EAC00|nr:flagellar biosynthetic protein FliO [Chitinolyticbacter albus]